MLEDKINFKNFSVLIILLGSFFLFKPTQAATSIVRGSAWWSSQASYLYFNCLDDVMGDRLDDPYNLCGGSLGSPLTCGNAPYAFHFYAPPCAGIVHQVYLNSNGNFSGSAWNYSKGLVTFDGTSTPDSYNFNSPSQGNCPNCTAANDCIACYNENTQQVYGWARATNDNSWLNLNPSGTTTVQIKSWNSASSTNPYYSLSAGDFIGYATTTTAGDSLSLNCVSAGGGFNCTSYKVYISNLQIGHLSAPNWNAASACANGALQADLKWDLRSGCNANTINCYPPTVDSQTAFEIIINTINSTTSPLFDQTVSGTASHYVINTSNFSTFTYNTNYFWWVRLRDENNNWTPWYHFGGNDGNHNGTADTITDGMGTATGGAYTFTTYAHAFPTPAFTWSPYNVVVGATTTLTSASTCFGGSCQNLWTATGDPDAIFYDPTSGATSTTATITPVDIIFKHATSTNVNLVVSDSFNYTCNTSTSLIISYSLPIWREVKAQ